MNRSNLRHLWLLLAALPCACTSVSSHLDGPVDFTSAGGLSFGEAVLHVELDGQATMHSSKFSDPPTLSGTIAADTMKQLIDDVAAVDLESFSSVYDCKSFHCGVDAGVDTATFRADGMTKMIEINRDISDSDLPPNLIKIFNDLNGIAAQLRKQQP